MPRAAAPAMLPAASSRKTARSGAMPPRRSRASRKIAGSGLRRPTSDESMTSSATDVDVEQAAPALAELPDVVGDDGGAVAVGLHPLGCGEDVLAHDAGRAALTHAHEQGNRVERHPLGRGRGGEGGVAVLEGQFPSLELVPRVIRVLVVRPEDQLDGPVTVDAQLRPQAPHVAERRGHEDPADVPQHRIHRSAHAPILVREAAHHEGDDVGDGVAVAGCGPGRGVEPGGGGRAALPGRHRAGGAHAAGRGGRRHGPGHRRVPHPPALRPRERLQRRGDHAAGSASSRPAS